jgi:hypothetical protein
MSKGTEELLRISSIFKGDEYDIYYTDATSETFIINVLDQFGHNPLIIQPKICRIVIPDFHKNKLFLHIYYATCISASFFEKRLYLLFKQDMEVKDKEILYPKSHYYSRYCVYCIRPTQKGATGRISKWFEKITYLVESKTVNQTEKFLRDNKLLHKQDDEWDSCKVDVCNFSPNDIIKPYKLPIQNNELRPKSVDDNKEAGAINPLVEKSPAWLHSDNKEEQAMNPIVEDSIYTSLFCKIANLTLIRDVDDPAKHELNNKYNIFYTNDAYTNILMRSEGHSTSGKILTKCKPTLFRIINMNDSITYALCRYAYADYDTLSNTGGIPWLMNGLLEYVLTIKCIDGDIHEYESEIENKWALSAFSLDNGKITDSAMSNWTKQDLVSSNEKREVFKLGALENATRPIGYQNIKSISICKYFQMEFDDYADKSAKLFMDTKTRIDTIRDGMISLITDDAGSLQHYKKNDPALHHYKKDNPISSVLQSVRHDNAVIPSKSFFGLIAEKIMNLLPSWFKKRNGAHRGGGGKRRTRAINRRSKNKTRRWIRRLPRHKK